jgi:hypothetical protein
LRYSFVPRSVEALGLQGGRLALFPDPVAQVPVRRLSYPSGFEHLAQVAQAIRGDVAALVGRRAGR